MTRYWLQHRGTCFPVQHGDCVIGRDHHCLIVLPAPRVSREHALVRVREERLEIDDLGSRNGTGVNGQAICGRYQLEEGDTIEIGEEQLEVLRHETYPTPATLGTAGVESEPTANAQRNVLELAEELLLRGAHSEERQPIARAIYRMIDTLVASVERTGQRLNKRESIRLVAVAQVVSRWLDDEGVDEWSDRVARTLAT